MTLLHCWDGSYSSLKSHYPVISFLPNFWHCSLRNAVPHQSYVSLSIFLNSLIFQTSRFYSQLHFSLFCVLTYKFLHYLNKMCMVFITDIILWKSRTHIIGLPSHYSINKQKMKLHQGTYNSFIKTWGETTAAKLPWSEQMTKKYQYCIV